MQAKPLSRRSILAAISAVSAGSLLGCKDGCKGKESDGPSNGTGPLKIGVLLTLSGPQGGLGKELMQGLTLALDRAGMQGGGRKIQLIQKDDKNDAQVGLELAKELIEKEKVDLIIGPSHSHVILSIRGLVHETKTILINPNAGSADVAGALCSPYIISTCRMNPLYPEAMGRYMAKKGIKNVAVIAANFAAGLDIVAGFKETFVREGNGKITAEVLPPLATMDFASFLTQLSDSKPEAVFAFFAGEQAIHFIKQYDQAGLKAKIPLYTTGYTVEQDVLPAQGASALGVLSTSAYSPFLDNEANKLFAPAYKNKYGTFPSEYAMVAYDAGQLLVAALNATHGTVDKDAFMGVLMTTKIDSPRGPFKFGPNHTPVEDAYLREVVDVNGQYANKVVATAWPGYYYPGEGCTLPGVKR
jgi:branched-chain amino acid transport system substrate-binding protein